MFTPAFSVANPDYVGTQQPAPIGARIQMVDPITGEVITVIPVFNNTGATIAAKRMTGFSSGSRKNVGAVGADAPAHNVAGVTRVAIPDQSWAFVTRIGYAVVRADAAVAAGAAIITKAAAGTNGAVDDAAVAGLEHCILGTSIGTAAAAGDDLTVRMSLP